jgi:CDK inhibitor PHO81
VCTALNWKQPNFPVFFCNDLGRLQQREEGPVGEAQHNGLSIKDAVRTAQSNNFMGLICCERLLVSLSIVFSSGVCRASANERR